MSDVWMSAKLYLPGTSCKCGEYLVHWNTAVPSSAKQGIFEKKWECKKSCVFLKKDLKNGGEMDQTIWNGIHEVDH